MTVPEPRTILLTGATGFVGRALLLRLARDGHRLVALVRDPVRARHVVGDDVELVATGDHDALVHAVEQADAIANLAGESILTRRWTSARKEALVASRVGVTDALARAARGRTTPVPTLVSASAVGVYGDRGDEQLDEASPAGTGFTAGLCQAWERAALGVGADRTVLLRIGIVLGPEGGVLRALAPATRARVAGRLGSGRQWVSWIHIADLVEMIATAIVDPRWRGAVNAVAPVPVTNAELVRSVARASGGAAPLPAPAFVLRAVLGARAQVVLDSQRCRPRAALERGFSYQHATLDAAVTDLTTHGGAVAIERVARGEVPPVPYLVERRPRYVLETRTELDADLPTVFRFFSDAANLELLTPPTLGFRILTPRPIAMRDGATIDYTIRLGGVPLGWRTVIERWQPNVAFVDAQRRGPYRAWWHEHRFVANGERTLMLDRVYYAPPFGLLGAAVHGLFIRRTLERIFGFRRHAIGLRFGGSARVVDARSHGELHLAVGE